MSKPPGKKLRFIGCEIIYREACALAARSPHKVDLHFLRKGLHGLEAGKMASTIQAAIDETAQDYDAVILGYARCSDGVVGLTARHAPLVVPRAHDCITFFFGGRAAYQQYFDAHPGTYYRTTGWFERGSDRGGGADEPGVMARLGLDQSYDQLVAKYGKDNADFIVQTLGGGLTHYDNLCYIEMGVCDERPFIEAARAAAAERGWNFDLRPGEWSLLEKLFFGQWDEDFVILQPGRKLVARNDAAVLDGQ